MAQVRGGFAQLIGGIKESVFGTTPATTTTAVILPIKSFTPNAKRSTSESQIITSVRDAGTPSQGRFTVDPSAEVPIDAITFGYWLSMFFGSPVTSGAGPYVHTFKTGLSIPSWVVEGKYSDGASFSRYFLYNGIKVNGISFTVDWGQDQSEMIATVSMMGKNLTTGTTSMDESPSSLSFLPFSLSQFALSEGGSPATTVGSCSFNFENGLDGNIFTSGSGGLRGDLPEGKVRASGTIHAMFDSMTMVDKATNFTESSIGLTATNGTNVMAITIDEVKYELNYPPVTGPEGVWVDMNWTGYLDNDSDSSIVKVVLTNSHSAYA